MKLHIENVQHSFEGTPALAPTTLDVEEGAFVSIVGPSGCGKSTLFNIISGLIRPTAGRVLLDGRDVTGTTGHVGYMLQKDLLLPWRTVTENIVLGAALHGRVSRSEREEAIALAERYGLAGFVDHFPHALSGGMRQRVALMRTLAFHKDVMLLDEPFGALDPITRREIQREFKTLQQELKKTMIFVTHDIAEAFVLGTRIALLKDGQLILLDEPQALLRSQHPEARAFAECFNDAQGSGSRA